MSSIIGLQDVRLAEARIRPHVHRTPVHRSATLDEQLGAELFFKCENFQKIGAFKARGATNAVLALDEDAATRGVITHSSGNHGAALAYAAGVRGVPCTVVMQETVPQLKQDCVKGYGAELLLCRPGERETTTERLAEERGMVLVHPFEDPNIIAGQGTACLELLDQVPELEIVLAPVGGGGLLAGTTVTARSMRRELRVIGAEPCAVDDAYRSLRSGVRQPAVADPQTWCDGLLTGLGEPNFEILRWGEVEIVTVEEDAILDAARFFLQRLKLVVEPSGATVLAALRADPDRFAGRRVGVIISGGNTDFAWM